MTNHLDCYPYDTQRAVAKPSHYADCLKWLINSAPARTRQTDT
jgi:hypothetical protein